ncbi:MAG: acyl-ACP--UDP-N-acetylglucosamine O-acyltransferase [Planctomycetota bacterium]|jgi:UDP-N-acetylglucosamine acyltransferase|nr:acyl-ACP--UDP-N-acetylglucosamine O-acyltransferase [Planctomycetota bacterium]MDP6988047.1 acyl-ACP--UDP-N-acetylglucosamine O-acyltransferase [Planctomycetota bacterium]
MSTQIHSTAVIAEGAELGVDVSIGPHTIVGPRVRIGDRTRVGPQVVIEGVTRIGTDNVIVGQASLGAAPQDFSYRGEPTMLEIGDDNMIREFVTINRGTVKGGARTSIGSGCLLMACSHVAHDCDLRDGVILANSVLLAGHVLVGERANLSGAAAAHHFCTIGEYAYVGGLSRVVQDVPPFMIVEGHPSRVRGVNVVGMQRAGIEEDDVDAVRRAFRRLYRSGVPKKRVFEDMRAQGSTPARVLRLVEALENTERGSKGRYRESLREDFARIGRERVAEWS